MDPNAYYYWIEGSGDWTPVGVVKGFLSDGGKAVYQSRGYHNPVEMVQTLETVAAHESQRCMVIYATARTQAVLQRWWDRPMIDPLGMWVTPLDMAVPTLERVRPSKTLLLGADRLGRAGLLRDLTIEAWNWKPKEPS